MNFFVQQVVMQEEVHFRNDLTERKKPTWLSLEVFQHETKVSPSDHSLRTTEKEMERQGDVHLNYNHFKYSYIEKYADMETTMKRKVLNDNQISHLGINVRANGGKSVFQKRSKDSSNRILNEDLPSQKAPNVIQKQVDLPYERSNVQPKSMVTNIVSKSYSEAHASNGRASEEPKSKVIDQGQVTFKQIRNVNNSMALHIRKRNKQGFNMINAKFKESNIIVKQQMKNDDKNKSIDDLRTSDHVTVDSKFHQAEKTLHHYCGKDLHNTTKLNFSKRISLLSKVHLLVVLNSPLWEVSS